MGEIMAGHDRLAAEYGHMLVSYMREDGFYLELPQLQRGLMWGLARLAMVKPDLLKEKNGPAYLVPYLDSPDSTVKGLAAWALGLLQSKEASSTIKKLINDPTPVRIYLNRTFVADTVGGLAHKALANIIKKS
jgi:HEAT repeat protein